MMKKTHLNSPLILQCVATSIVFSLPQSLTYTQQVGLLTQIWEGNGLVQISHQ